MKFIKMLIVLALLFFNTGFIFSNQSWYNEEELKGEVNEELQIERKNISGQGNDFLQETLTVIEQYFKGKTQDKTILILMLMVFALGFLHATTSGHGKGILLAHMMDPDKTFLDALKFISIFTITHIIDIILLGTGISFLLPGVEQNEMIETVKWVAGAGLIFFAFYLMIQGILIWKYDKSIWTVVKVKLLGKSKVQHELRSQSKGSWLLGFLTGLAPCPFGWAIFFLLLGLSKDQVIHPFMIGAIILIFALGIFIFLFFYAVVIYKGRNLLFSRFKNIEPVSVFISGFFLFLFALYYYYPILFLRE